MLFFVNLLPCYVPKFDDIFANLTKNHQYPIASSNFGGKHSIKIMIKGNQSSEFNTNS